MIDCEPLIHSLSMVVNIRRAKAPSAHVSESSVPISRVLPGCLSLCVSLASRVTSINVPIRETLSIPEEQNLIIVGPLSTLPLHGSTWPDESRFSAISLWDSLKRPQKKPPHCRCNSAAFPKSAVSKHAAKDKSNSDPNLPLNPNVHRSLSGIGKLSSTFPNAQTLVLHDAAISAPSESNASRDVLPNIETTRQTSN